MVAYQNVIFNFLKYTDSSAWNSNQWTITWNQDTPALQFSINSTSVGKIEEYLPVDNVFRCQIDEISPYFYLCEYQTKRTALRCLYEEDMKWWEENVIEPGFMYLGKDHKFKFINNNAVIFINDKNGIQISKGKIRQDAVNYFGNTYKIRLQVKPEYQIWMTNQLLVLFNNPEIGRLIEVFKCSLDYSKIFTSDINSRLASIVIYVRPGRNIAIKLLRILITYFNDVSNEIGTGLPSRFNHQYNKLIFWSNGDGDNKQVLIDKGLANIYLDKHSNPPYAHFIGNHIEP